MLPLAFSEIALFEFNASPSQSLVFRILHTLRAESSLPPPIKTSGGEIFFNGGGM